METALIINAFLAGLTFIYVTLTFFLLRNTFRQNRVIYEQLRINTIPLFDCEISLNVITDKPEIFIKNIGQLPAFDLDIYISGILFEDDIPRKTLIKKYILKEKVKEEPHFEKESIDDDFLGDGQYGIFERGIYPTLPPNRYIDYITDYKINIDQYEILIQFRDYLGNNYAQMYWFYKEKDDKTYKFGLMKPNIPTIIPRFDLMGDFKLNTIPKVLHFTIKRILISIPANYVKEQDSLGIENRWPLK